MSATHPGKQWSDVATLSGLEVMSASGHILAQLTQSPRQILGPLPRGKKGVLHLAK